MHPIFEHRPSFAGFDSRALELDGSGPPVLFLHGYADSADTWRYALDHMRRAGRRALALDMPGFGQASRLDREQPILPQLDRFAAAAIRHLAAEGDVIVVGNSLGGCVAIRAAQDAKLPIEGIVPVAPAGLDMPGWFAVMEGEPLIRTLLRVPVGLPEAVVREAVGRVYRTLAFSPTNRIDPGVVAAFTSHVRSRRDVVRIWATGRRLLPELDEPFELDRIGCPVLLVWGDRDRMVRVTGAERVLGAVSDARLEVIENCGHCPQIEVPERLADLLLDFPASLARAA
jgi:pimeloyl-ACP methyl ester carboxylesterase